jgi:type II secretory ATPase GspE/PulE/Tfp pilus assembly ATPase PilB-like protein
VNLERAVADSEAVALIPKDMARRLHVLPLTFNNDNQSLTIAMTDTFNVVALDQISVQVGRDIELIPVLAGEAEIEKSIDQFYGFVLSVDGILNEIETGEIDYQSLDSESDEYSQPVVRLVNALLSDAVKRSASDIHFEPEEGFLRFRYRIDGVLRQIRSIHKNYWPAIAVRLKVMSGMDIAETRAPQDGRISLSFSGRQVDFRVSTLPTVHGENIVLRVLDRQKGIVALDLNTLKLMIARPEGIILVTGPTGSGKTTTLYSILNHLNTESVNIMTLEDPVEYPTSMIRQTSASETSRLDFASGIRSMMRQDPDIILVGEIRDEDTASMALRAAMTGHQVFSTQRLIRKLCSACKESYHMSDLERNLLGLKVTDRQQTVFSAKGCKQCDNQGYKGRLALLEILHFDSDMDEIIARRGTQKELMRLALSRGFKTLADMGALRVLDGSTSLEEISRVIDLTGRIKKK